VTICDLFTVWWINFSGFMNSLWFTYNENLIDRWWKFLKGEGVESVTNDLRTSHMSSTPSTRPTSMTPSATHSSDSSK
jgi:hypothetical protein